MASAQLNRGDGAVGRPRQLTALLPVLLVLLQAHAAGAHLAGLAAEVVLRDAQFPVPIPDVPTLPPGPLPTLPPGPLPTLPPGPLPTLPPVPIPESTPMPGPVPGPVPIPFPIPDVPTLPPGPLPTLPPVPIPESTPMPGPVIPDEQAMCTTVQANFLEICRTNMNKPQTSCAAVTGNPAELVCYEGVPAAPTCTFQGFQLVSMQCPAPMPGSGPLPGPLPIPFPIPGSTPVPGPEPIPDEQTTCNMVQANLLDICRTQLMKPKTSCAAVTGNPEDLVCYEGVPAAPTCTFQDGKLVSTQCPVPTPGSTPVPGPVPIPGEQVCTFVQAHLLDLCRNQLKKTNTSCASMTGVNETTGNPEGLACYEGVSAAPTCVVKDNKLANVTCSGPKPLPTIMPIPADQVACGTLQLELLDRCKSEMGKTNAACASTTGRNQTNGRFENLVCNETASAVPTCSFQGGMATSAVCAPPPAQTTTTTTTTKPATTTTTTTTTPAGRTNTTTPTPTTPTTTPTPPASGLSKGAIVGIVFAVLGSLALCGAGAFYLLKMRQVPQARRLVDAMEMRDVQA